VVENSGRRLGKERHLRIAEFEVFALVGFAGQLLKLQVDHWQMQDAQDVAEPAR